MFYYKITAKLEKADESEEQKVIRPRDKSRILAEKICLETEGYNDRPLERYIFTAHITDKKAVCGVFSNEKVDTQWILSYLEVLEIKHTKIIAEEITFSEISSLISKANRGGYVEDDDEILEKLKLYTLRRYNDDFEMVLEEEHSRKGLLKQAKEILSSSLEEELQRIFASHTEKLFFGHPVHYILETDSREECKKMLCILLSALYQTGRLKSRRYTEIGFDGISQARHRDLVASSVGGTVVLTHDGENENDNEFSFHSVENHKLAMETMREFQNDVLTVLCLPKSCNKLKEMLLSYVGNCAFVEIKEEVAFGKHAKSYLRHLAQEHHITPDKSLYTKLSDENKGFAATELRTVFEEWRNVKLRTKLYPQYSAMQSVNKQITAAKPNGSAYDELQKMIGLADVKKVIDRALNYYKAQKVFKEQGMTEDHPVMHMVFTGNPGTAKTTVARLFAQIMKENGLLSEGKLYEVGRADLVGKYVGWTAQIVKDLFKEAKGSVIFIDEAYSLLDDKSGMYGDEAINTIVQEMENHREDIVVIFAGYPKEMEQFLSRNPGLRSRIAYHVPFADYSAEELYQITELIASQKGMTLSAEVKDKLIPAFEAASQSEDFGNGRFVRNLVEQAQMNLADRLIKSDWNGISKDTVTTLLPEDFEQESIIAYKPQERKIGFV